ncbi:MAG: glycine cleavage system protein GcvH [Legionellaceae bacterium]|jgi:glycine cleavage system H protein|nr:glycine cleavage system protein GcvH [Legionellaceae bacterium]
MMKFTSTHEWINTDETPVVMGITHHAQSLLGDLVFIELPEVGQEIKAGDELGVVESVKAASDFYAPISGTVIAVNEAVVANPELVNSDAEGTGWLLKIQSSAPDELNALLDATQYENTLTEEH